ncbi:ABC transporter permease [Proteiniphilum sp. UBA5384]|uniref:ABC transporter permease n=1 Tax=Proteiniphilum sp. UBA5384 TaxID=1947279 RepID=UPI0025D7A4FF|nr:FtsX-like permease family protein [Proteiniphilum sp. UBA5384]
MWKSAIKQLWKNRKSNRWIFIEIVTVAVLLWYCVDFLYVVVRKNTEPLGINLEHVYRLKLGVDPTQTIDRSNPDSIEALWINPIWQIVQLVNGYPGVETTAYYYASEPYDDNLMFQGYTADEENAYGANIRYVSENYDKVFKVKMKEGGFTDWGIQTSPQGAVVSPELADSLFHTQSATGKTFRDYYEPSLKFRVAGVSQPTKYNIYERYGLFIYTPFNMLRLAYTIPVIGFRISPEADIPGFEQRFTEEMKSKLNIGPFYLFSLSSYDYKAEVYETATGINKYVNIITWMILFFLFIIFLGMLGTFWFQMESRQGEIGLRMALGSSRKGVLNYIMTESLALFSAAFLPALIICASLAYWDVTYTYNNAMDYTWGRFWITIIATAIILAGTILVGVLIPARRAAKLHPVEALREE